MLHDRDDPDVELATKGSAVAIGFGPSELEAVFELFRDLRLVTPAADLAAGLTAARRLRPDMVMVGSADARDVVAAVRRDPELRLIPVVALAVVPGPPRAEAGQPSRVGRRTHHQVAQALQRLMLDEVMKVSYILASAANSGNETADRQVMMAIERLDNVAIGLRDAVIDLERGPS